MAPSTSARRLGALALAAGAAAAAACSSDPDVRGLTAPAATNAGLLLRYVALGNSITAGFQSSGINDSTQRASYANLLARAAGVRFAYPSLAGNGCPAPLVDLLAGTRVGGAAAGDCPGRAGGTDLLNNVAVPGANSFDPIGAGVGTTAGSIGGYSALTRVFLGNLTQVQKAVQANPTFASVWIGNNDVLSFAIGGDTATRSGTTITNRITLPSVFAANYAATVDQLRAGSPELRRGVLIGVVDVTNAPQIIQLSVFNSASTATGFAAYNPAAFTTLRAVFGVSPSGPRPAAFAITFNANCNASQAAISFQALAAVAAAVPATATGFAFNCAPGATAPAQILDDAERAVFVARVAAYNAYIKAKADSVGFFYYDPNVRLAGFRATPGAVLPFVNLQSQTQPFGANISRDGVHPSTRTHVILATDLRDSLNAKYGTTIPAIDTAGLWSGAPTF
jgi:hypothetical protein